MLKYITSLESLLNNYKVKDINQLKEAEELRKAIEAAEQYEKDLKHEQFALQRQIRGLNAQQQVYLKRDNNKIREEGNMQGNIMY